MGEKTGIAWTDHTFNPWIGCTKVSAGCTFCYGERDNNRFHWVEKWGKGQPRRRTSRANWNKVLTWDKQAEDNGVFRRVFCGSLCDILDDEVCEEWRMDLWALANKTHNLEWLFLTKREENIEKMFPATWLRGDNPLIRLGVTAENQEMYNLRTPGFHLWNCNSFVSIEPMLGEIDLTIPNGRPEIDWVIVGAESGPNARPMDDNWVRNVRGQCVLFGIPFFYKQQVVNGKMVHLPELDGVKWTQFPSL